MIFIGLDKEAEMKLEINRIYYIFVCLFFWTASLTIVWVMPQLFGGYKSFALIATMATVLQILTWVSTKGYNRKEYPLIVFLPGIFFATLYAFAKGIIIPNIPITPFLVSFILIVNSAASLIAKHSLLEKKEELLKESF